jgi:DNA invertase Pin-like site-specific DNA recombinase
VCADRAGGPQSAIKDCRAGDTLVVCNYRRLGTRHGTFNATVRRLYGKDVRIRHVGEVVGC